MIGKTLGHYQITGQLGKGGMGEVYQAKDQRLGREVAIKVLPKEFAQDADRVARFEREAKLLASLNHQNIAAIHGLEESGGTNFLVLELVQGETLADRIKQGSIPVEEALKLALQIAEALEAAHDKGVIHRDLKPANIKVTPDGKVKVLDFGLAKAYAGEQVELNLSNSPTLSDMATQQGIILGTAAYMAPEQARGKNVDKRADIWAFGCLVYEMLTSQAAFQGEDITEILAAVVKGGANLDLLPINIHPRVREAITRCLQKDLNRRYQDIRDARYEIEAALTDHGGVFVQPAARKQLRVGIPWIAATLVMGAIIAGMAVWKLKPSEPRKVVRLYHELQKDQEFSNALERNLAVSPDGRYLVFGTSRGLYLRSIDELEAKLIPGTEGNPEQPFYSPDGKWIGYWSKTDRKVKKIAIGSVPVALCDAQSFNGGSWGEDDRIIYGDYERGIMGISANGGTPELLAKGDLTFPQILPDGKSVLLASGAVDEKIAVLSLQSGKLTELFPGDAPQYLSTGHISFLDEKGRVAAISFHPDKLEISGGAIPLVEGVLGVYGQTQYTVSNSGILAYIPRAGSTDVDSQRTLVWVDRNGNEEPLGAPAAPFGFMDSFPAISPDGTRLALSIDRDSNPDIWIWDLFRKTPTRLTFDSTVERNPIWTPDGKRIAFMGRRTGQFSIYWKSASGTGKEEPFFPPMDRLIIPSSWAEKGKILILEANQDIGMIAIEVDRKWKTLLGEKYNESQPRISPNGKWMAYCSDESGQSEIYVRPFPEVNADKWPVSVGGGDNPLWSKDRLGLELFYRSGDAAMVVPVTSGQTFSFGTPRVLFRGTFSPLWDISKDNKRFLMMKRVGSSESAASGPRRINIVVNWTEELKQRVPVR